MTIEAVVFDLFHTLIDPEPLYPPGFDKRAVIADIAGVERAGLQGFWVETYVERETTTVDLVDLFDRHCTSVGRPLSPAARVEIDEVLGVAVDRAIREPDPEIVELLAELDGRVAVGVLSNCHEREVRHWDESPLAPLVQVIGRSCRIGAMKPDRVAFDWVVDRLGVDPSRSLYVGNGGSDELAGARRSGFATVVHMNAYDRRAGSLTLDDQARRAGDADVSVDSVAQLVTTIGRMV